MPGKMSQATVRGVGLGVHASRNRFRAFLDDNDSPLATTKKR
jgi:hypothetical protein